MRTLSLCFCSVVLGVMLGYGWFHLHQDFQYKERIESWVARDLTKTKTRNYRLMEKDREGE